MLELFFKNPIFDDKTKENLTVRKGVKWDVADLGEFNMVELCEAKTLASFGHAEITRTIVIPFDMLTDKDLIKEHDPECRNVQGLTEVMHRVYPDFDSREIVTLVYFKVI